MRTNLEEISQVKKKLTVEVDAELVDKKLNEAYNVLKKRARVKGFRPGKVPRKILERYFGPQVVDDVTRGLVSETLPKAVEEVQAFPLGTPIIEHDTLKAGQDFKYAAIMETRPSFDLKDYEGIEIEKEILSVTEDDVNRQLEDIRKANGELKPVQENRGIQEDDHVVIEYEAFEGDRALEDVRADNFMIRVGSHEFHKEVEEALIGLRSGESTEVEVAFADDYVSPKLAGKKVLFKIKVKEIKTLSLPELTDDFARSLGAEFKDLETLKAKIREQLVEKEEKRIDLDLKKRLLEKICDSVDFELPESLVESEIRYGIETTKQNLERIGSSMEKVGLTEEKLREEVRPASEKRVKQLLILGEIARQKDLSISEEELSEGFKEMGEKLGQDPEMLRRYYEGGQLVDAFREKLLEEKTLNYLLKAATIKDVEGAELKTENK